MTASDWRSLEYTRRPSSSQRGLVAFALSALTRRSRADASDGTSQTSLVLSFVASTRELTVNATHFPSGDITGLPIVLTR